MKLLVLTVISSAAFAQLNTTTGPCSPIATNNSGSITINCSGLNATQGADLLKIVNKILSNQKDLKDFGNKLDEILKGVNDIRNGPRAPEINQSAPGGINSVVTGGNPTVNNTVVNPRQPPRRISADQQQQISAILGKQRGSVSLMVIQQDPEAYQYAKDWYAVFDAAGWEILEKRIAVFIEVGEPTMGILIKFHGEPVPQNGFVQVEIESPVGALVQATNLLGMTGKDVRAQRYMETPEGRVIFEIATQPTAE